MRHLDLEIMARAPPGPSCPRRTQLVHQYLKYVATHLAEFCEYCPHAPECPPCPYEAATTAPHHPTYRTEDPHE